MVNSYIKSAKRLIVLMAALCAVQLSNAQVTKTVGTTGADYATISAAFTAINAGSVTGAITLNVINNTTEPATPVQLNASGIGSANYTSVLIKPNAAGIVINSAATPTSGKGIIELCGADNVTIDGSSNGTTSQDLTIQLNGTTTTIAGVRLAGGTTAVALGCNNITIKNCKIVGNATSTSFTGVVGIVCSSGYASTTSTSTFSTSGTSADPDNVTIQNNTITKCYYGIYFKGTTANPADNLIIRGNTIGSATSGSEVLFGGMDIANTSNVAGAGGLIESNDIQVKQTGATVDIAGIFMNGCNNTIVRYNKIHDVINGTTGGYGAYGMYMGNSAANSAVEISNNFIWNVLGYRWSTSAPPTIGTGGPDQGIGLLLENAANTKIWSNTINLYGAVPGANNSTTADIAITSSTAVTGTDIRNNILINTQTTSTNSLCVAVYTVSGVTFAQSNYNIYYVGTTPGTAPYMVGYLGANKTNLAAWQTATGKDANSLSSNPLIVSNTDLHITNSTSPAKAAGSNTGVYTDFDLQTRGTGTIDIGGDEFSPTCFSLAPVTVSGITQTGATLNWTAGNPAPAGGYDIYYSTSNTAPTGATTPSFTGVSALTQALSSLSISTTYYVWIRSNCSTSQSNWSGPTQFTTLANPCVTPTAQTAGPLTYGTVTSTSIPVTSFPAASPAADGYLVVYSTSSSLSSGPVDGTTYSTGNALGGGTVVQAGATTSFTISTLTANTLYYIFIYSYNNSGCSGGPKYLTAGVYTTSKLTCTAAPTALVGSAASSSSATITWTNPTGATSYVLEYKPNASVTWTTASPAPTGSPYTLTGLTGNTLYDIRLTAPNASCGTTATTTSAFTTQCVAITPPYSQNFDGVTAPAIPSCHAVENTNADANTWVTCTSTSLGNATAVTPNSGTNQLGIKFNSSVAMNDWFFLPVMNLTGGTSYRLNFYYRGYTGLVEQLEVKYGTAPNSTSMTTGTIVSTMSITGGTGYALKSADFTPASSGTYYIGFHGLSASNQWYIFLDDLSLDLTPACGTTPTVGTVTTTSTSASIPFTCTSCTGNFIAEYSTTSGFTPGLGATAGGGTVTTAVTSSPISLSGLTPNTTYYVYVRNNCSGSSYSPNSSLVTFTTPCNPISVPYSQNFDGVTIPTIPTCHSVENTNGDAFAWQTCSSTSLGNGTGITPNSGANQLGIRFNSSLAMNDWFFLPGISLTGGTSYRLKFYYRGYTSGSEQFEVKYGTNANSASMTSGTLVASTSTTAGTGYTLSTTDFIPASTGTYYIGFHGFSASNLWYLFIDDVSLDLSPACPTVPTIGTITSTANTASIPVTCTSCTGTFIAEYSTTAGFSPGTGATAGGGTVSAAAASSPISLSGLSPNTTYYVYVRNNCSGSNYSANSAVASFTTQCSAATLPYTQNFDGVTQPAIPSCHTVENTNADGFTWKTCNSTSLGNATSVTPNSGTNQLGIAYNSVTNSIAMDDWFFLPSFNLTGGTSYRLTFWCRGYVFSGTNEQMEVKYGATANSASMTNTIAASFTVTGNVAYAQKTFDFTPASSGTYSIGLHGNSLANKWYLFVDDIGLDLSPTCFVPTALTATPTSTSTANLSWTAPATGTPAGYDWEVRTSGAGGSGATGLTASGSTTVPTVSASTSALAANTTYSLYVRTTCGGSNTSTWAGPVSFTTPCSVATIPYTQNFDGVTQPAIPSCHSVENTNADAYTWKTCNTTSLGNLSSISPNSGTNQLGIAYSSSAMDDWFFLPSFNLTAGTYYRLTFWYRGYNSATYTEQMEVKYGTSATSGAMTNTITSTFSIPGNVAYTKKTIDFTPASSGTYFIGLHGNSIANQYYIFVDDISLDLSPSCLDPSSVTATSTSASTASISWSAPVAPPIGGYQYEVRTSGAAGSGATGLAASGSTAAGVLTATATGLTANTTYTVYVRSNCGAGGFSNWTTGVSVTTTLDCSTATVLTCGVAGTYSVAGTTGVYNFAGTSPTNSCGNATPGPEQFFSFTPSITGSYKFDGVKTGTANVSVLYKNANLGCGPTGYTCLGVINAGGFSTTITLTAGNTYLFIVDNQSSANSATGTITVTCPCSGTPSAGVITQTSPQYVCGTSTVVVLTNNATNTGTGITYQWEESDDNGVTDAWANAVGGSGATTLSYTTPAITKGIYYRLKATCTASALSATSAPLQVIQNAPPVAAVTPAPTAVCLGSSTTLTATPASGVTYAWSNSGNTQAITVSPASATTYTVTVTNPSTTCTATASSTVSVNPAPPVTTGATVCQGGSAALTTSTTCPSFVPSGLTYSGAWNGATDPTANRITSSISNSATCSFSSTVYNRNYVAQNFQVSVTGSYTFEMVDNTNYDGMAYIVTGAFVPGNCAGGGTWIVGDDDGGILGNEPLLTATLTAGTTYTLISTTYALSSGTYTGAFSYAITAPGSGQIMLPASPVMNWYDAVSGGSIVGTGSSLNPVTLSLVNANTPGTYTYYAACSSNSTCRTATNLVINAKPVVSPAAAPAAICNGNSSTLSANATAGSGTITTYSWSAGISGNNASGSVSPTANTSYTVTVTNSNTCTASGTTSLTVNDIPTATPSASTSPVCAGVSSTLSANATAGSGTITGYSWSSGLGNVASGSVTPATTTTYTVTVTNSNTCTSTGSVAVNVNAVPVVNALVTPATICNGATVALDAGATAGSGTITTYNWSSGLAGNAASGSVTPGATTTYNVTVTNSNNCTATGAATVTVNACSINTWLGNTTDWHTATNWSSGFVPTACSHNVLIPNVANDPVITTPVSVGNIELQNGALLTLNAGLNTCGNFKGGTTTYSQVLGTATLTLNGSSPQQLSGRATFNTLRLNNAAGAALQSGSSFEINTALELQSGTMNTTAGTILFRSTGTSTYAVLDNFSTGFTGTLTGSIRAYRYYGAAGAISHYQHLLGSPVNNAALSSFGASGTPGYIIPLSTCDEDSVASGSPFGTVFSYDETQGSTCSAAGWKVETTGNMTNAKGYSVWKAGIGVFAVTGTPNLNASYTVSGISNSGWNNTTKQGRPVASGWHLVANPYLADLDISAPVAGFDPNKMVWQTSGPFAGSYQPATVVAPFQAFMVRKSVAGGSINYTINGTQRTRSASPSFQKLANDHDLSITATNNSSSLQDVTYIAFNADASDAFDPGYDGIKSAGAYTRHTLYTHMADANTWLLYNNVKDIETTSTVPMGFEPGVDGSYTFSFNGINTFDPTSYVMLEDKKLNVWHNVRNGDYTFNSLATDNWDRFVLHFTPAAKFNSSDATCQAPGQISITQPGSANWNYTIVNTNNVVVSTGSLSNNNSIAATVAPGVYTVTLVDNNGYSVVKNIQVGGVSAVNATMQASSNLAQEGEDFTFTNTTANAATITWNFGDGTPLDNNATTTHAYATEGVYTVSLQVTNADGCSSTVSQTVTVTAKTATGIKDITATNGIAIYSAGSDVFVGFGELKHVDATIDIYNILGQKVLQDKWTKAGTYTKRLSNLDAAYIVVRVNNDGVITTKKLFITGK